MDTKQAGNMFEASCRNRNANLGELAGSLNKHEGNTQQTWSFKQAQDDDVARPKGSSKRVTKETGGKLEGMLEASSKEARSKVR